MLNDNDLFDYKYLTVVETGRIKRISAFGDMTDDATMKKFNFFMCI